MKINKTKLIVLRGNSGTGKSTIAEVLRENNDSKIAIVSQDILRRVLTKKDGNDNGDNIDLIKQTVEFSLDRQYNVILEGIFHFARYKQMFEALIRLCPDNYFYYFDIPFEETIKRHLSKPNSHEFGEQEMKAWFRDKDLTNFGNEKIITQDYSINKIVRTILLDTKLYE